MLTLLASLALAAEPVLPVLEQVVPAAYPEAALAAGQTAAVLLEIDVLDDGSVLDVRVVESAGEAFDAAAVQAARSFRFTPGRGPNGDAVTSTILYRTTFEPTAAPPVSVEGRVKAAGTRELLGGFEVVLEREERRIVAETDADGAFRVAGLDEGGWTLTATSPGYRAEPVELTVTPGKVTELTLYAVADRPWDAEERVAEVVEVVGRRTTPEITERVLDQEEIRYLPGTNGDVVRVVQNLPGVARPPLNIGQLIIRGTAPEDSAYYLDGAQIPNVFHFAGFSTVLNGDAIAEIAFLPGNYGVRYGRTLGGAVDLRVDTDLPSRSRGYVSVDLFQATAFVEQRVSDRLAVTVSGRRSYADTFLNPALNSLGTTNIRVPRYYDLQARVLGVTPSGGSLDVLFLMSDDRFAVIGQDADEVEQVQIGLQTTFQKIRLLSRETLGGGWSNEFSAIAGPESQSFNFAPDGVAYEKPFTLAVRNELYDGVGDDPIDLGWRIGVDAQAGRYAFLYDIAQFGDPEGATVARIAPALYAEPTIKLGVAQVTPGLRADALFLGDGYTAYTVDPRLSTRFLLGSTTLQASAGGYSQFPQVRQAVEQPDLTPLRSWQASVGAKQQLGRNVQAEVTGFHNWLTDLVSGREDAFRFYSGPPPVGPLDTGAYANVGVGRVIGAEALLRYSDERTAAWISATVSRSTRTDRPGEATELFDYDQPLVLTALGSRELPRRWRLGARVRYGSGNPYTAVVNRFQNLDDRSFVPVYGEQDAERLPPFWSLDVRIDKDWVYKNWTLTAYLDMQNATNNQNVEVMGWTYDYAEQDPITSIPVVPAFGLRGEW